MAGFDTLTAIGSSFSHNDVVFDKVSVVRGEHFVLCDLTLELPERRIGIIGANGSGKSTFARLLNGLTLPTKGRVMINNLDTKKEGKKVRRKVGFVFQNPDHQIVMPLVEEDLAFGLKNLTLDKQEINQRITTILARYDLSHTRYQSANLLSGGQKQLLAICGVLIMQPQIIVFDEPTTLLDLRNKKRIAAMLASLPQQIFVVSHDMDLIRDFDRILVFDEGRLVCDAPPDRAIGFYEKRMS